MKFSSSVVIDAPPEKVFSLVDNLEEWPQWIPSITRIEKLSDGPLKEGSQIRVTAKSGITVKLLMTITEFVPAYATTWPRSGVASFSSMAATESALA